MQKWQCQECGELVNRDISLCVCGYNENEVYNELPAKELFTGLSGLQGGKYFLFVHELLIVDCSPPRSGIVKNYILSSYGSSIW